MTDVQITVRLGRKPSMNLRVFAFGNVLADNITNKVRWARVGNGLIGRRSNSFRFRRSHSNFNQSNGGILNEQVIAFSVQKWFLIIVSIALPYYPRGRSK